MIKALGFILFGISPMDGCMALDAYARSILCPQMPVSMGF